VRLYCFSRGRDVVRGGGNWKPVGWRDGGGLYEAVSGTKAAGVDL